MSNKSSRVNKQYANTVTQICRKKKWSLVTQYYIQVAHYTVGLLRRGIPDTYEESNATSTSIVFRAVFYSQNKRLLVSENVGNI